MKRQKKDKHFVHRAFYKGGMDALRAFIQEELKYPESAKKEGVQGTVNLKFHVNHKGLVHNVKVVSGIGYGCDEEAIRIASLLKYEVPKSHKIKVGFQKRINIHFRLKKVPAPAKQLPVEPTPVVAAPELSVPATPANVAPNTHKKTYTYTISSTSTKPAKYSYTIKT